MSNKITTMDPSTVLTGDELLEIVQDGVNKRLPVSVILDMINGISQAGLPVYFRDIPASEALLEGMIVNVWNDGGVAKARKSDSALPGKHAHGFILVDVAQGANARVYFTGVNDKCTGLVIGDQYLSTEQGRSSQFTPTMSGHTLQTVGLAVSSTVMIFNASDAVILG